MAVLKWRNVKIGFKYGIALTATIILFVIAAIFVTVSLSQIEQAVTEIEISAERSVDLTQMSSLYRAKELVIMDYINVPRKSLIEEYDQIQKEYLDLQARIEPKMDTEDLKFLFDRVKINNALIGDVFKNTVVTSIEENRPEDAKTGIVKIGSSRKPTIQLYEKIKENVDAERELKMQSAYSNIQSSTEVLNTAIILVVILGSIIVFFISRGISRNLSKVVSMTNRISNGELNVEALKYVGRDEIGQLSESINKMQNNFKEMILKITEASNKVNDESSSLMGIASEVQQSSEQIAATMEEMSAGAEEQAGSANEIASSILNLTELIDKANTNKKALQISSRDISAVVQKGSSQMETSVLAMSQINDIFKDTVSNVKQLENNSEKISVLVQIINDIAEQTNLLALNAAIEAARAGEAGRGFAVVADEIRKLAEQVGKSVKEITGIVLGIQDNSKLMADSLGTGYKNVQEGTNNIKTTGEIFIRINTEIGAMVEKIESVASSLEEISQNGNVINTAAGQIAAISQENSAGIEETVASVEQQNNSMEIVTENSHSLANSASLLKQLINQFKI